MQPVRLPGGGYAEPRTSLMSPRSLGLAGGLLLGGAFFALCVRLAEVDPVALMEGLPRLVAWAAWAWPPQLLDLDIFILRGLETVAIATVGTAVATLLAFPLSVMIARNIAPAPLLSLPIRWFVNACRGIDTVVFALLFVAAVGLGPFAGVLGMVVHSVGVIAKLNAEAMETVPSAPLEAAALSGANGTKIATYAMMPTVLPNLASISLYMWEANVRTSTILGIVGAGGIGIEIKAAIDLLDFPKLLTLSLIVLVMVTAIDQFSAWLRRKLGSGPINLLASTRAGVILGGAEVPSCPSRSCSPQPRCGVSALTFRARAASRGWMTAASSAASSSSSRVACAGAMRRLATAPTRPSTTASSAGAAWVSSAGSSQRWRAKQASQIG
jgi:phosphonate transport system permease protein